MLNPSFDELYITAGDQFELYAVLKGHQSGAVYPND
jgi:hypothetical protein